MTTRSSTDFSEEERIVVIRERRVRDLAERRA